VALWEGSEKPATGMLAEYAAVRRDTCKQRVRKRRSRVSGKPLTQHHAPDCSRCIVALSHHPPHGPVVLARLPPDHSKRQSWQQVWYQNAHNRNPRRGTPGKSSRACRTPDQPGLGWSVRDHRPETPVPSRLPLPARAARVSVPRMGVPLGRLDNKTRVTPLNPVEAAVFSTINRF